MMNPLEGIKHFYQPVDFAVIQSKLLVDRSEFYDVMC